MMKLNLLTVTDEDILALEDYLFATDPLLKDLEALRGIDSAMELSDEDMRNLFPEYMGEDYAE